MENLRIAFKDIQNEVAYAIKFVQEFRPANAQYALYPIALENNMPKYPLNRWEKEFVMSIYFQLGMSNNPSLSTKQVAVIKKINDKIETYMKAYDAVSLKYGA